MGNLSFSSLFAYLFALGVSYFFASRYETEKNNIYFSLSLLTTILFCGFRFFVGNDYEGYYNFFHSVQYYGIKNYTNIEPAYYYINYLFRKSEIGYFYVLFICSTITYTLIYLVLREQKQLKLGVFVLYTMGLLIFANNAVRQGVAISIFLYSITYIIERKLWRYVFMIVIAMTFHFSAVILLPLYFLPKLKLNNRYIWILLFTVALILAANNLMYQFFYSLVNVFDKYNHFADSFDRYSEDASLGFGIFYIYISGVFVAMFSGKHIENIYVKLYLIGTFIVILSFGYLLTERIGNYMMYVNVMAVPIILEKLSFKLVIKYLFMAMCLLYFSIQSLTGKEKNGAVPYRTIFYEDMVTPKNEYFKRL